MREREGAPPPAVDRCLFSRVSPCVGYSHHRPAPPRAAQGMAGASCHTGPGRQAPGRRPRRPPSPRRGQQKREGLILRFPHSPLRSRSPFCAAPTCPASGRQRAWSPRSGREHCPPWWQGGWWGVRGEGREEGCRAAGGEEMSVPLSLDPPCARSPSLSIRPSPSACVEKSASRLYLLTHAHAHSKVENKAP